MLVETVLSRLGRKWNREDVFLRSEFSDSFIKLRFQIKISKNSLRIQVNIF